MIHVVDAIRGGSHVLFYLCRISDSRLVLTIPSGRLERTLDPGNLRHLACKPGSPSSTTQSDNMRQFALPNEKTHVRSGGSALAHALAQSPCVLTVISGCLVTSKGFALQSMQYHPIYVLKSPRNRICNSLRHQDFHEVWKATTFRSQRLQMTTD
ncbi:hypothetical protein CLAIMM_06178 isoform 1 [Cladophialophora immunda]|nr:hypothetical protein CLAIMM_06178 isoform 1 [Cladophialophora immunda]